MGVRLTYIYIYINDIPCLVYVPTKLDTLQETNISPKNGILKMIFLSPRWDMLIPWRVFAGFNVGEIHQPQWAFGITYSIGSMYVFFTCKCRQIYTSTIHGTYGYSSLTHGWKKWSESHHPLLTKEQHRLADADSLLGLSSNEIPRPCSRFKNGGSWQSSALLLHFEIEQWKNPGCLVYIGDYTTQLLGNYNKPFFKNPY